MNNEIDVKTTVESNIGLSHSPFHFSTQADEEKEKEKVEKNNAVEEKRVFCLDLIEKLQKQLAESEVIRKTIIERLGTPSQKMNDAECLRSIELISKNIVETLKLLKSI